MKTILYLSLIVLIAACTGGNESSTGQKDFLDYLPSIIMGVGGLGALINIVKFLSSFAESKEVKEYRKHHPFDPTIIDWENRVSGDQRKAKLRFFWSLLIFAFGFAVYFFQ